LNYIATARTASSTVGGGVETSSASISSSTTTDVFEDLANGVQMLLTRTGSFNVDRKAGLLQVSDLPERLDRVSLYLDAVQDRVHRQVQIDALIIEVEPNDEKATGIDWTAVAFKLSGAATPAQRAAPRRSLTGLRVTDLAQLMRMLAEQGTVVTIASPRMLTMNNEPAIVRTDGVVFSVTAQIASDAIVTLSVSPVVKAPVMVESDMLARVADGETLVISGFTRERETRARRAVGIAGGWFGRGTVVTRKRVETVILLTPRIIAGVSAQ
jgi:type II secretory pathway component GspD/PulD (secretin)